MTEGTAFVLRTEYHSNPAALKASRGLLNSGWVASATHLEHLGDRNLELNSALSDTCVFALSLCVVNVWEAFGL